MDRECKLEWWPMKPEMGNGKAFLIVLWDLGRVYLVANYWEEKCSNNEIIFLVLE